jgi:hypothetical protein
LAAPAGFLSVSFAAYPLPAVNPMSNATSMMRRIVNLQVWWEVVNAKRRRMLQRMAMTGWCWWKFTPSAATGAPAVPIVVRFFVFLARRPKAPLREHSWIHLLKISCS